MNKFTITHQVNKLNLYCTTHTTCTDLTEHHYELVHDESVCSQITTVPQMPVADIPCICLHITAPAIGFAGIWKPDSGFCKNLTGDWSLPQHVNLSHSAPVISFFDYSGQNCFTVAFSEANRDMSYVAGIHEETGEIHIDLVLTVPQTMDGCHFTCRVDCRNLPFHTSIKEVSQWWDTLLPDKPMPVPECARLPMYSTWYSYHQDMTDESLYNEYRQAAKMGMRTVIIDDGWQTTDNGRGYGFCGDWEPAALKFPDFRSHVEKIHALGMKCLIWYSVPFVGEYSGIWTRFKNMLLSFDATLHAGVLDPRYPEVREYLISTYENAVLQWNLDGLKLDFIDSFRSPEELRPETGCTSCSSPVSDTSLFSDTPLPCAKKDFQEVQDAVYCLMIGIYNRLKNIREDLLIEFRQTYIGPQMRRFGNIFRVGDCPLSGITNRVGITDLKLTSGDTAVHSDMLMWHEKETPENIAVQLINCIFATLQISVKINTLSPEQKKVLEHYLDFSIRYKEVLQQGDFVPQSPLASYPVISSRRKNVCILAVYDSNCIANLPQDGNIDEYWILNGCLSSSLVLSLEDESPYATSVQNCMGECVCQEESVFSGICTLPVPSGGAILLKKVHPPRE